MSVWCRSIRSKLFQRCRLPPEAYCQAEIRMEVRDQACVHVIMVGGLAVGLPVSAWVFPDGSPEWGVFPEICTQARNS